MRRRPPPLLHALLHADQERNGDSMVTPTACDGRQDLAGVWVSWRAPDAALPSRRTAAPTRATRSVGAIRPVRRSRNGGSRAPEPAGCARRYRIARRATGLSNALPCLSARRSALPHRDHALVGVAMADRHEHPRPPLHHRPRQAARDTAGLAHPTVPPEPGSQPPDRSDHEDIETVGCACTPAARSNRINEVERRSGSAPRGAWLNHLRR